MSLLVSNGKEYKPALLFEDSLHLSDNDVMITQFYLKGMVYAGKIKDFYCDADVSGEDLWRKCLFTSVGWSLCRLMQNRKCAVLVSILKAYLISPWATSLLVSWVLWVGKVDVPAIAK